MSFTNPDVFILLLLIPIFMRLGWPRHVYRRRRDTIALGIRLLLVLLIILSLAGFQIRRAADKLAVVFLIDVSDSMDAVSQEQAIQYVRESVKNLGQNDQAAVILFGENALVEHPMDTLINLRQVGTDPIRLETDMSEAIRLGLALFPPDTAKRMVILSDGLETVGDSTRAAELAAATNVQIDYVPFGNVRDREVLVSSVRVPTVVGENEPFDLVVAIENKGEETTNARLSILVSGELQHDEVVELRPGTMRFAVGPFQFPTAGAVDFRVIIEPQTADGFTQNNELSALTQVTGRPRVLIVTSDPAETQFLEAALREAGLEMDTIAPENMPLGLARLSAYRSVILANVSAASASAISDTAMDLLQIYVRDLGGGLVVIGGPDSYGVGGYFETPLEETLPVEMRIKDEERIPKLTMVYVIDRSGSMEVVGPSGFTNLELAKEAVLRSINFLNNYDRAGVVSFDTQAFWVVDIQDIGDESNRSIIENLVGTLRSGGGTDIYGGLFEVSNVLPDDPSNLKHIILLTDGGANPEGIIPLVSRMNSSSITTSVVAVGQDYAPWLRDVAGRGGGNFSVATTVESIPAIFSAETVLATRAYIVEEPFVPTITAASPLIENLSLESMPLLLGYVATTPKSTATVVMTGPHDDPILAQWQYGLGRAVAFTSDATQRWGDNWLTWEDYTAFWNQTVRWTITEGANSNVDTWVEDRGEQSVVVVDARDGEGNYLNALDLNASIIFPDRITQSPEFKQVAPGRYEAPFVPDQEGAYFIGVAGATRDESSVEASVAQNTGWVLSYSSEYNVNAPDVRFLQEISSITGGTSLAGDPSKPFIHNLDHEEAATPMWPYLLSLAAILLVMDIAVRRLVINRSELEKVRERVGSMVGRVRSTYEESEASGRLSDLKKAKQRVIPGEDGEKPTAPIPTPRSQPAATSQTKSTAEAERPKSASRPKPQANRESAAVASQLLKKKRERE